MVAVRKAGSRKLVVPGGDNARAGRSGGGCHGGASVVRHRQLPRGGPQIRFAILAAVVAALGCVAFVAGAPGLARFSVMVQTAGIVGPAMAVLGSALLVLALVPRAAVAAAGGLMFGPVAGTGYVFAGACLGAVVAFGAGRLLGRDFVVTRPRGVAVDRWITKQGTVGVVTARLLPLMPFGLVSYAFGSTNTPLRPYAVGTALAILPGTAIYASLGASAMSPATPLFAVSLVAALALPAAVAGASFLARRRKRPGAAGVDGSDQLRRPTGPIPCWRLIDQWHHGQR
jgi:uncharacterized membrane protein YdjX (TVP38/TMEM64 family)